MMKSECAKQRVVARLDRADGPVHLAELIGEAWELTDDGDPRWIGVALMNLNKEGLVRYLTCDDNHNHGSTCAVELTAGR